MQQGKTMDEVGSIASLNEDLQQSERYIDTEMGVPSLNPAAASTLKNEE